MNEEIKDYKKVSFQQTFLSLASSNQAIKQSKMQSFSLTWCEESQECIDQLTSEQNVSDVDYVLFAMNTTNSSSSSSSSSSTSSPLPPCMELLQKGSGGRRAVYDLLASHSQDDAVVTGAFLASAIDQRGSVVSVRRKYIHLVWIGPKVKIMLKGKVMACYSQLFKKQFPGCTLYLQLLGEDDDLNESLLAADNLQATLLKTGGAHKPTRYSFTNETLIGTLIKKGSFEAKEEDDDETDNEAKRLDEERIAMEMEDQRRRDEEARIQELQRQEDERRQRHKEEMERQQQLESERKRKFEEEQSRKLRQAEEEAALKAERNQPEENETDVECTNATQLRINRNATLDGKQLVLLISTLSGSFQQTTNQSRLRVMVDGLGLPSSEVIVVDGSDQAQKEQRNKLFGVSGIRAMYPQVFLQRNHSDDGNEETSTTTTTTTTTTTFVGDYETMEYHNDTGTLAQTLGVVVK